MKSKNLKREQALDRNDFWRSLSYQEQLQQLRLRPGKCKKQIARIKEKMKND